VTHDVAATADFYTRIMGMELASTVFDDSIPSTGDPIPYFHIFFRMQDARRSPSSRRPACRTGPVDAQGLRHLQPHRATGLRREEVMKWYEWLKSNGVDVIGPTDHKGLILSIYFHDPSGFRLEITTPLDVEWNKHTRKGYEDLAAWVACKEKAQREGRDIPKH
jgi:catechol 2,3-dioxygenase-like lactoylglutathione lyase family enzyme